MPCLWHVSLLLTAAQAAVVALHCTHHTALHLSWCRRAGENRTAHAAFNLLVRTAGTHSGGSYGGLLDKKVILMVRFQVQVDFSSQVKSVDIFEFFHCFVSCYFPSQAGIIWEFLTIFTFSVQCMVWLPSR